MHIFIFCTVNIGALWKTVDKYGGEVYYSK